MDSESSSYCCHFSCWDVCMYVLTVCMSDRLFSLSPIASQATYQTPPVLNVSFVCAYIQSVCRHEWGCTWVDQFLIIELNAKLQQWLLYSNLPHMSCALWTYILAQFRPLWIQVWLWCRPWWPNWGVKLSCYCDPGLDQLETKTSLPSKLAIWRDNGHSCRPNWHDKNPLCAAVHASENNRCLAHVPSQQGKWNHRVMPCQMDTVQWGCSSRSGLAWAEMEIGWTIE